MSDQTTTTTAAPNAGAGQTTEQPADAGQKAGQEAQQPAQPFAVFETAQAFQKRLDRESRKILNQQAKALGYDDWQEMSEALQPLRRGDDQSKAIEVKQPESKQPPGVSDYERLRMALAVGQELNLPTALVSRLQGATLEEMKTDAQALLGLMGSSTQRGPGIPPAPHANQPATFTRNQLSDPVFVRANREAILQAGREGRIVNS